MARRDQRVLVMSIASRASGLALLLGLVVGTAGVARADDPAADGSYLIRSETLPATLQGSSVNLEVVLPVAGSFARPVVIICHGWMAPTLLYEGIAHHLASRGFAAVLFEQPNFWSNDMQSWTDNTKDAISELARLNADPKSAIFGELDMDRVGVIGHSRGGACATMIAGEDPRVKCAVGLAPANWWTPAIYNQALAAATKIKAPYMAIIGASDTWLASPAYPQNFYDAATQCQERQFIEVTGGGHMMYFGGGANDVLSSRYYTAWLERFLMQKADPDGWTTGAMAALQKQQGVLTVAQHASVSEVQQKLHDLGFYQGAIDGIFGDETKQAVEAFQTSRGLTADGIVGPKTRSALGL